MPDIWVPMDSGVIVATLEDGAVTVVDQIAMERRPISLKTGFGDTQQQGGGEGSARILTESRAQSRPSRRAPS